MIKDMRVGSHIEEQLVLTAATKRMAKSNPPRPFAALTFGDGHDTVSGNIWNYNEPSLPEVNKVYNVIADVGEYNGAKQLNNIQVILSQNQDLTQFSLQYCRPGDIDLAWEHICDYRNVIASKALQAFIDELVIGLEPEWRAATSAITLHHVGIGGNIVHTYEVLSIADAMACAVSEVGYPVARDLVIAGAILHDIGKLDTYRVNGVICEMTYDGALADHVALGSQLLWESKAAKQYPDLARLLNHIILSHHGKLEYGCPVVPKMIEAEIVARADGLSAMLAAFEEAETKAHDSGKLGALTDRAYTIGNSQLPRRSVISDILNRYTTTPVGEPL